MSSRWAKLQETSKAHCRPRGRGKGAQGRAKNEPLGRAPPVVCLKRPRRHNVAAKALHGHLSLTRRGALSRRAQCERIDLVHLPPNELVEALGHSVDGIVVVVALTPQAHKDRFETALLKKLHSSRASSEFGRNSVAGRGPAGLFSQRLPKNLPFEHCEGLFRFAEFVAKTGVFLADAIEARLKLLKLVMRALAEKNKILQNFSLQSLFDEQAVNESRLVFASMRRGGDGELALLHRTERRLPLHLSLSASIDVGECHQIMITAINVYFMREE